MFEKHRRPRTEAEIRADIQRLEALNQQKARDDADAAASRRQLEADRALQAHQAIFRCQFPGCTVVSSGPKKFNDEGHISVAWHYSEEIMQCLDCKGYFCSLHFLPDSGGQKGGACVCLNCHQKRLKRQAGETSWLDRLING